MNLKLKLLTPLVILLGGCSGGDNTPPIIDTSESAPSVLSTSLKTNQSYKDIADAAVWVDDQDSTNNLLIVSLEEDGLVAFDAAGKQVQRIDQAEVLGADIRYNISDDQDNTIDLLAVGLPDDGEVGFYSIDRDTDQPLSLLNNLNTGIKAEAICLYQNITTKDLTVTLVTDEGTASQYKLKYDGTNIKSVLEDMGEPKPVRTFNVGGELSACIVDDELATLYIAEQDLGIWAYGADIENVKERRLVDSIEPLGHLKEIEGLDIAYSTEGKGYLVAADEQAGFVFYERADTNKYVTTVQVNGFDEAKALAVAPDAFWLANTEADEPVYEKLLTSSLNTFLSSQNISFPDLVSHRKLSIQGVALVQADGETAAVDDDGDAADDPAFWLNSDDINASLILGTNKQGGLMAYSLTGEELQYLKKGEPNNIDLRNNILDGNGNKISLAAASNREHNTIALYKIQAATNGQDPIMPIAAVGASRHPDAAELRSNLDEVYGLCMYEVDEKAYVFINGKDGKVEQWELTPEGNGFEGDIVRTFSVDSQPEGCVVDDETDTLYLGEENVGIWSFEAQPNAGTEATEFAKIDNKALTADVEGLTLFDNGTVKYLIASSQGSNSFAIYDLNNNNNLVGTFAITGNSNKPVDGASDTDGIHVVSANLGVDYPEGMFIAQDWHNINADYEVENQNFKMVSWKAILDAVQN